MGNSNTIPNKKGKTFILIVTSLPMVGIDMIESHYNPPTLFSFFIHLVFCIYLIYSYSSRSKIKSKTIREQSRINRQDDVTNFEQ